MISFESRRKIFHMCFGIFLLILMYFQIVNRFTLVLILLVGILMSIVAKKIKIPIIHNMLLLFERKTDLKKFPGKGAIYYVLGMIIVLTLFPTDVAFAAIMVLALGDTVSNIIGRKFGRKMPFSTNKTVKGSIAGFIAALIGTVLFLQPAEAIICAFAGMFTESFDCPIDDNITVPLGAALGVVILRITLG